MMHMDAALIVGATAPAWIAGHQVGDRLLQTGHQAIHKGDRGLGGWWIAGRHAGTYTLATAALVGLAWAALGLPITVAGFIAGQAVSGLTHWWIDRRYTLRAVIAVLDRVLVRGKLAYYDDIPGGAEHIDQAAHWLCIAAASMVTALI